MKRTASFMLTVALIFSLTDCASMSPATGIGSSELNAAAITSAVYPQMAPYPASYVKPNGGIDNAYYDAYDAWWKDVRTQRDQPQDYADGLDVFFADSIKQFLSDSQGENKVYSPLNVYMALGMLAEVTDGESRSQVLTLLGADSIETLRAQAKSVWNANYLNDGVTTSILASSLWLNENIEFTRSTLDSLAENYYASSYQGTMGSEKLNKALQAWINEQTGDLLKEQTSGIEMDEKTIMSLVTTINFHAKWHSEFSESRTEKGVFHSTAGDLNCDFMRQDSTRNYYWGELFSAVSQSLENSGEMWFILPDEGVSIDDLLQDEQAMSFIVTNKYEWENSKYLIVNLAVPKFDVVSDLDLISGLKDLGVTDVFDSEASDFSPMTEDTDEIFLSQIRHAARVMIDEEGCTAVAYTVMAATGTAAPPDEKIDFTLDRPFIFVITGTDGLPLFVGVVNQPSYSEFLMRNYRKPEHFRLFFVYIDRYLSMGGNIDEKNSNCTGVNTGINIMRMWRFGGR